MENEVIIGKIVEFIKRKSRERGLSINKMLLSAKLSAHLIDDWQNGRAEPSFSALQAIGEVLGVDDFLKILCNIMKRILWQQKAILGMWGNIIIILSKIVHVEIVVYGRTQQLDDFAKSVCGYLIISRAHRLILGCMIDCYV